MLGVKSEEIQDLRSSESESSQDSCSSEEGARIDRLHEFVCMNQGLMSHHTEMLLQLSGYNHVDSMYVAFSEGLERLGGYRIYGFQELRNMTADYIKNNPQNVLWTRYLGDSPVTRQEYLLAVRQRKEGNIEVDLESLSHALRVNVCMYRATGIIPGFDIIRVGRPSRYPKEIKMAYCALSNRFFGVEKISV